MIRKNSEMLILNWDITQETHLKMRLRRVIGCVRKMRTLFALITAIIICRGHCLNFITQSQRQNIPHPVMPESLSIYDDKFWRICFIEYHKFLLSFVRILFYPAETNPILPALRQK